MDSKILGSSPRMTLWVGLALASTPSSPCPPRRRGSSGALRAGSCSRGLDPGLRRERGQQVVRFQRAGAFREGSSLAAGRLCGLAGVEGGVDDGGPEGVALGGHVEVVGDEDVFRLAVWLQHGGDDVDVGEIVARIGESFDLRVEVCLLGELFEALFRRLGGDEPDGRRAKRLFLEAHELDEVCVDVVCSALVDPEIILAGVEDDFLRMVGRDDAVEIVIDFPHGRTAEAAVDDGAIGKIFLQRFPETNGRRANEQRCASGRHGGLVARFERRDGVVKARGAGRRCLCEIGQGRRRGAGGRRQQGEGGKDALHGVLPRFSGRDTCPIRNHSGCEWLSVAF